MGVVELLDAFLGCRAGELVEISIGICLHNRRVGIDASGALHAVIRHDDLVEEYFNGSVTRVVALLMRGLRRAQVHHHRCF